LIGEIPISNRFYPVNILIAGAGNMGVTYARSLLATQFTLPDKLHFLIRSPSGRLRMPDLPDQQFYAASGSFVGQYDILILAVKPQDFSALAPNLFPFLKPDQLILSIMAGISLQSLYEALGVPKLIRAMPNLPSRVGKGMTVYSCSTALDRKELFIINNLLNTTGKALYVEEEGLIDAATALSGSGPAYVYYLMDALVKAGMEMGFSEAEAALLVRQTFLGALDLQTQQQVSAAELIAQVASKGGTTEAALKVFESTQLPQSLKEGVWAAYRRSKELGK
jgi:pyrroline-5-carboxylate reductase